MEVCSRKVEIGSKFFIVGVCGLSKKQGTRFFMKNRSGKGCKGEGNIIIFCGCSDPMVIDEMINHREKFHGHSHETID